MKILFRIILKQISVRTTRPIRKDSSWLCHTTEWELKKTATEGCWGKQVTADWPCRSVTLPKDVLWLWLCVTACVRHHSGSQNEKTQRLCEPWHHVAVSLSLHLFGPANSLFSLTFVLVSFALSLSLSVSLSPSLSVSQWFGDLLHVRVNPTGAYRCGCMCVCKIRGFQSSNLKILFEQWLI